MRGVVVKVLGDFAASVRCSDDVPVDVVRAARCNPLAADIVPNFLSREIAYRRSDAVRLSIVTELHDAWPKCCFLWCVQDQWGDGAERAFGIDVRGACRCGLVVMRVVSGPQHSRTCGHTGRNSSSVATYQRRIEPVVITLLREITVEVVLKLPRRHLDSIVLRSVVQQRAVFHIHHRVERRYPKVSGNAGVGAAEGQRGPVTLHHLFVRSPRAIHQASEVVRVTKEARPGGIVRITCFGRHGAIGSRHHSSVTRFADVVSPGVSNTIVNHLLLRHRRTGYLIHVQRKVMQGRLAVAVFDDCSGRRGDLAQLTHAVGHRSGVRLRRHATA